MTKAKPKAGAKGKPATKAGVKARASTKASKATAAPRPTRSMRSSYDAAQTTAENRNHWAAADSLGPIAANNAEVRARLRYRSRYEEANNGYFAALIEGRANDTIGTGPRLQLTLPETWTDPDFQVAQAVPPGAAREVELLWKEWSESIDLAGKLATMDMTETRDGEVFLVAVTNPSLPSESPMLDVVLYEGDQCTKPTMNEALLVDGIEIDAFGNPTSYWFLAQHPGESIWTWNDQEAQNIDASRVFHFFHRKRPNQARGVTPLAPALPLGSVLRRYTGASLSAAEAQAYMAAVLKNENLSPDPDNPGAPEVTAMEEIPFAKALLLTLHAGQEIQTITPSQPAPNYREFKNEVLTECGRAIGAARNKSTGSSAEYNYSSGRLDQQDSQQSVKIRRERIRRIVLDRLFRMWFAEAALIPDYLPQGLPPIRLFRWLWRWDAFVSIDPLKDANAAKIRMESALTTMERECGETGGDWEEVLEQQAREMNKRMALGLPDPNAKPAAVAPPVDPNADPSLAEDTANVA